MRPSLFGAFCVCWLAGCGAPTVDETAPDPNPGAEQPAGSSNRPLARSSLFPDATAPGSAEGEDAQIAVDDNGVLHMLYSGLTKNSDQVYPMRYGECASDCDRIESWRFITIADHLTRGGYGRFAVDPFGRVRVVYDRPRSTTNTQIMIAACDAECTDMARWTVGVVREHTEGVSVKADGSNIAFDKEGNLMLAYLGGSVGASYGECAHDCTSAMAWSWTQFSAQSAQPALIVTASGKRYIAFRDRSTSELFFTKCDADCNRSENWSVPLVLGAVAMERFALAQDTLGRPRLVWSDDRIHYASCDMDCTQLSSWRTTEPGLPAGAGQEGLALTFDTRDRAYIAFDCVPQRVALSLATCGQNCEMPGAAWSSQEVESSDQLAEPLPALPGCPVETVAEWLTGAEVSVTFNPMRHTLDLVTRTTAIQRCGANGRLVEGLILPRFSTISL